MLKGKHNISENRARLLPQINIGAGLNDNFTPPVSVTDGSAYGKPYNVTKTLQYNSSASVQLQMPLYNQTALTAVDIAKTLAHENYDRVICFCNTKGSTERLTKFLQMRGVDAQCIHGDIPQRKREEVMQRFRDGKLRVFVATDVASRGIDVDDVDAVFNYEVPEENEYYVHRIGRTGRAKRRGVAYTLVSDYPSGMRLDEIAKFTGNEVKKAHLDAEGKLVED